MRLLYDLGIRGYTAAIFVAALFYRKAREWVKGRQGLFNTIAEQIDATKPSIWMHCASLGEFEQGRPLLEALRNAYPNYQLILTFFSPSGYRIRKDYQGVDFVYYLPADTRHNARRFVHLLHPKLAIFVKYEFWYHYLDQLARQQVPTLLISALFRPDHIFFKPYGGFFRKLLHTYSHLFVQNETSAALLHKHGVKNYSVVGDTRFDRVYRISQQPVDFPIVEAFAKDCRVLVGGSTWAADEALLADFINSPLAEGWRFIIAPHEIHETGINRLEASLRVPTARYTQTNVVATSEAKVLIVDTIGMLSSLYRYGACAYIGGGFGRSIHNTQEAIVYGLPVIFGPKYIKFVEAVDLVALGGAFAIHNYTDLESILEQLANTSYRQEAADIARRYAIQHQGATEKIVAWIEREGNL